MEIELKLQLLERIELDQLLAIIGDSLQGERVAKTLRNTYFDTADERLSRRKMALRVRETGGRFIQTLKIGSGDGALQQRGEWECEIGGLTPDLDLIEDGDVRQRMGLLFQDQIAPVFTTDFTRQQFDMLWPPGRIGQSRIELALDEGTVSADDRSEPILEIELELKEGTPAHLFDLAGRLAETLPVRPGHESKAAIGYRLRQGQPPRPSRANPPEFSRDMKVHDAIPLMLREACAQWIANAAPSIEGSDPEGVHQFRVALRRLRSLLSLFKPWFAPSAVQGWNSAMREQLRHLGPARQIDVFIGDTIQPLATLLPDEPAIATVAELAIAEQADAYEKVRTALNDRHASRQMLDFMCWIEQGTWQAISDQDDDIRMGEAAAQILAKRYKKVTKHGKGFARMPMDQRHELRLLLKKLRYAVDFLGPIFDGYGVLRKSLSKLQDELGVANDLAECRLMMERLECRATKAHTRLALARADGIITGWSLHRMAAQETRTAKAWKTFRKAPLFWEIDP